MKCHVCKQDIYLQCADDNPRRIDGNPVCDECYFNKLGECIEEHPVGTMFYRKTDCADKKLTNNTYQE